MHVNHHVLCVCCRRCSVACVRRSTQYENVEGEKGNTHGYSVCGGLGGARRGPVWSTCAAPAPGRSRVARTCRRFCMWFT